MHLVMQQNKVSVDHCVQFSKAETTRFLSRVPDQVQTRAATFFIDIIMMISSIINIMVDLCTFHFVYYSFMANLASFVLWVDWPFESIKVIWP